ncbi:MAG: histone deacetylase family protein [Alphaproteobacteria bacterium]|nr:histone deacetylase family protein [Alphaproteobacteria bacterium]
MTTMLFTHQACFDHDTGRMHPEHPSRLKAVLSALDAPEFGALIRREAPPADIAQIARVHPENFVRAALDAMPKEGLLGFDADTIVSPGSREAVLRAAGAVCAAVDAVVAGEADNAFCAVRPPGHHAEPMRAMGFCIFNNIAVGALHARAVHGARRVAVIDVDVHHGNGTQAMFERDGELFYASTHQWPLYPGTGARSERGVGNIFNEPLSPMSGSAEFRKAMTGGILPALEAFRPDLVMISAGFDAHADDPLASLRLTDDDYDWVTRELAKVARAACQGRVVSALEGGYDLDALGRAAAKHVRALMAA